VAGDSYDEGDKANVVREPVSSTDRSPQPDGLGSAPEHSGEFEDVHPSPSDQRLSSGRQVWPTTVIFH